MSYTLSSSWTDTAHVVLNTTSIGLDVSGIGVSIIWIPDVLDGMISVYEGDWTGAKISAAAMLLGVGVGANAAKISRVANSAGRTKEVEPIKDAGGSHTTWKSDPQTGGITRHETWNPNPKNPTGWDKVQSTD